ncbi:MAG: UbiA family prenyltransferase [Desulfobacterales bacterium]|jgi:4-hydroxybenzoate polyprenyltransferase|nr:UbiA family prenyltransferase [Desulfobacteraceae bacterium]MDY0311047.1 UbiA family prenyltransferase [Desulfobacterales bacterium]
MKPSRISTAPTTVAAAPFFESLKLFMALSRTPHGMIDMATPALGALLWLGALPPLEVILVGLVTVFSGYTAVYALNDLVDCLADRDKVRAGGYQGDDDYLDGALVRHPLAQGMLGFRAGAAWAVGWTVLAMIGAWWLNPVCLVIFLAACVLEVAYCRLWRVSPFRTVISGVVKTAGTVAAVFAVDPAPSPGYLLLIFFWLFCWEVGGQNIPADWTDLEEDRHFNARTIPVSLGTERAMRLILLALGTTVVLSLVVFALSPLEPGVAYRFGILAIGAWLLLHPAVALYRTRARREVMTLFNRASYYPITLFFIVLVRLLSS